MRGLVVGLLLFIIAAVAVVSLRYIEQTKRFKYASDIKECYETMNPAAIDNNSPAIIFTIYMDPDTGRASTSCSADSRWRGG